MGALQDAITKTLGRIRLGGTGSALQEPAFWLQPMGQAASYAERGREKIGNDPIAYARELYLKCGPVFACSVVRQMIVSEVTFGWRTVADGKEGGIYTTKGLESMDAGPGGLPMFLNRLELDNTNAGNAYYTHVDDDGNYGRRAIGSGRRLTLLRPDWVTQIIDSASGDPNAIDAKTTAIIYHPYGLHDEERSVMLMASEFGHYMPNPDPVSRWRGMSWMTPVVDDILGDRQASKYKEAFYDNGAMVSYAVVLDPQVQPQTFQKYKEEFRREYGGMVNANKPLFLGGGADVKAVGANMQQLDFRAVQGAGETRIAQAAQVHPVIAGLSESMQGTTIGTGNYGPAKRRFVEATIHPLWVHFTRGAEHLFDKPGVRDRLWFNADSIPFLREDQKELSEIMASRAGTVSTLLQAGFTAESVVDAVENENFKLLEHSGLFSVQLQAPGGSGQDASGSTDLTLEGDHNGSGNQE